MSTKLEINFPITLTAADNRKRTISGTIVSWNEKGMTSAGATVFQKDSIDFSKPVKLLLAAVSAKSVFCVAGPQFMISLLIFI